MIEFNEHTEYLNENGIIEGNYTQKGLYYEIQDFLSNEIITYEEFDSDPTLFRNNLHNLNQMIQDYKETLNHIYNALQNLESNPNIPEFSRDDVYNTSSEISAIETLINTIETEISGNNLNELNILFQGSLGESDFNSYIADLQTILEAIRDGVETRVQSDYFDNVLEGLKKWREFWIKERIIKPTGSLTIRKSVEDNLEDIEKEIKNKNESIKTLLAEREEWIPTPMVFAAFYDPIFEPQEEGEEIDFIRRISVIYSTQQHAEEYFIYRKTISDFETGISEDVNEEWGEEFKLAKLGDLEMYRDTYNLEGDLQEYIYRVEAVNTIEDYDEDSEEPSSIQSPITSEKIDIISGDINNKYLIINSFAELYILLNDKVNYIKETQELEDGNFRITLRDSFISIPDYIYPLTCVAPNHFMEELKESEEE